MRDDRPNAHAVRRVYLVVLAIPLVLVAGLWVVQGVEDPFRHGAFTAVVAVNGLLVLGVANGRLSLRAAGPWVVLSSTAILVSRLLTWEAWPSSRPDDVGLVIAALAWPEVTGWSQVNGRDAPIWDQRLELDLCDVEHPGP